MKVRFFSIYFLIVIGAANPSLAQGTGPGLPKPIVLPASTGTAVFTTTTMFDQNLQKYVSVHTIEIHGDATLPLYNSLSATQVTTSVNSTHQTETRVGRNIKCSSKSANLSKSNQKINCEMTVIAGEFSDISLEQFREIQGEKTAATKSTTSSVKAQVRSEGVVVNFKGLIPLELGADELFNSLDETVNEPPKLNTTNSSETRIKNMLKCEKIVSGKNQTEVICTVIFNKGVALFPSK